jgi:hypothetical protein
MPLDLERCRVDRRRHRLRHSERTDDPFVVPVVTRIGARANMAEGCGPPEPAITLGQPGLTICSSVRPASAIAWRHGSCGTPTHGKPQGLLVDGSATLI